jgi:RNA polymerase sigma-70 factor (ECF subfamily)
MTALDLLAQWRGGDEAAARELFDRYSKRLTALAEQHLSAKLGKRLDGEDIVQSVFRTFFQRSADGQWRVEATSDLWQLLVTITLAKVRSQARRHGAARRDVSAEASHVHDWLGEAVSAGPSPEDAMLLVDQMQAVLQGLPETYSEILTQRLEGRSRGEIAATLGISRQTVYRALDLLRDRLEQLNAE